MAKTRRRADGDQNLSESASNSADQPGQMDDAPQTDLARDREARSPERIAARAYELYLARGGSDGQDFEDWLAAERELSSGPSQDDPTDR